MGLIPWALCNVTAMMMNDGTSNGFMWIFHILSEYNWDNRNERDWLGLLLVHPVKSTSGWGILDQLGTAGNSNDKWKSKSRYGSGAADSMT